MQTGDTAVTVQKSVPVLRYSPSPRSAPQRAPLREAVLLVRYHLRLLDRWPFALMALAFLGCALLAWAQAQSGTAQGLSTANDLSRFVLEPGAGLFAGVLAGSLVVSDPLLEATMATPTGIHGVVIRRFLLTLVILLVCSVAYLAWSLGAGITYARQQSPLYLLLVWLVPVMLMGMLGLFGSLITRNAALGMALAAVPLAGSLFLYAPLLPIQAAHLFFVTYTYSGGQDASDWWANRLSLLAVAMALAVANLWLLHREERLLASRP